MKSCGSCQRELPDESFYKTHYGKLSFRCRECTRLQVKEWKKRNPELAKLHSKFSRIKNVEKRRQYARDYYKRNPDVNKRAAHRAKLKFPHKVHAREVLQDFVSTGRIIRPERCMVCGERADRIEGHHPDYSLPLAVIWCCTICHASIEKKAA